VGRVVAYQPDATGLVVGAGAPESVQPLTGTQAALVAPMVPGHCAHLVSRSRTRALRTEAAQRLLDVVLGSAALAVLALPMAIVALMVRITSPGPVVFAQTRVGHHGRPFRCLKFRTMRVGADTELSVLFENDSRARAAFAADFKLSDDPRVTRVGRLLRRTSLDELPQLVNVVRGDMSLVGPRPVVPEELWRYGDRGQVVLQVRPGMTGPWQVSDRTSISYPERIRLDVDYALHRSASGDLRILGHTVRYLLKGQPGAV
jgi:lipopolysaccharide/colanic/teichoic acid biosynthesis glycosyltransferase